MPIYKYGCSECNIEFELFLFMKDNEKPVGDSCDVCGAKDSIVIIPSWNGAIGDAIRMGKKKPDQGWTDRLAQMQEDHPAGNFGRYAGTKQTPLEKFEAKMGKKYSIGVSSRESSLNMGDK